jgi:hypothetical protein
MTNNLPLSSFFDGVLGVASRDLRGEMNEPGVNGARAALETFYFAFNSRSLLALRDVWAADPLIQLNNPLGGIRRGQQEVLDLYQHLFDGPARVWVEFYDIVQYVTRETAVFAGRERGAFTSGSESIPLSIRTTRIFRYMGLEFGWRQVHHHGSIDDAALLKRYQQVVQGHRPS